MITENPNSEPQETNVENLENIDNQTTNQETPHETEVHEEETHDEVEHHEHEKLTSGELMNKLESLINSEDAGANHKKFNAIKEMLLQRIHVESDDKKESDSNFEHPLLSKVSALNNIFREKYDVFHKKQESEQKENLEKRTHIIEKLKNLYSNSTANTNLFRAIREIKEEWSNAGQVPKSEFKNLNNNYFFHLNQFYQMLDLNKEYREQEYAHNLEKRNQIIARAKELQDEPVVQKALNELQYLHRLWKEEAEPVAEEFREKTWEEFKTVSNKIHERKAELTAQIEAEQLAHLEKKNDIISQMNAVLSNQEKGHQYWQNAIKKIEELRSEFLKTGNVPRRLSNENWNAFKVALKDFNSAKNNFYKSLKSNQLKNLEDKLALIKIAKDNMLTEDWEMALPLYKKLQDDWKKIGHVPRNMTDKTWADFREACNGFFNNYREKKKATGDNWKENFKLKTQLLADLKAVSDGEGSVEKIEAIKTEWNAIGKVPREKMNINSEFNKVLREKLKLNKINEFELKEDGLSGAQLTDKARKMKNQIAELESEITTLENNLGFFSNPSRENPLLTDTYNKIDEKKELLESMKVSLHQMIAGE